MSKDRKRVSYLMTLLTGLLLLGSLSYCSTQPSQSDDEILGITPQGERVKVDPSKICWSTVKPIPEGFVEVPDPVHNQFLYRRATGPVSNTLEEPPGEEGGSCTCACSTGHCDPIDLPSQMGGGCGCVIKDGCTTCTRTAAE